MKLSASATIVSSTWAIRRLNAADIGPDWLDGFQRRQDVTLVYRGAPGDRRIATEPFIDDWSADERRALCRELEIARRHRRHPFGQLERQRVAKLEAGRSEPRVLHQLRLRMRRHRGEDGAR
ncbi:hypothetical protein, partial [Chromobacterium phragmitis]